MEEVVVRLGIVGVALRHPPEVEPGVEPVAGVEESALRLCQLEDSDDATGRKHPGKLSEALLQGGEVADAKGAGDRIDSLVRQVNVQRIADTKSDPISETGSLHLTHTDSHHLPREIHAGDLRLGTGARKRYRHVTRAGRHVEDLPRVGTGNSLHQHAAPVAIEAERVELIQQVVLRRNLVKHLPDLGGEGGTLPPRLTCHADGSSR